MDESGTRMLRRRLAAATTMLSVALLGCGGGPSRAEVPETVPPIVLKQSFTSKADLEKLAAAPTPAVDPEASKVVLVDDWSLEGKAAGSDEEEVPPEQAMWRSAVVKAAGGDKKAAFDPALHCVAEQLARFRLAHEGAPEPRVRRFLMSRCGATHGSVSSTAVAVTISAEAKDVEAFAAMDDLMHEQMKGLMAAEPEGMPVRRGVWFHRDGEQAVFSVVSALEELRLEASQEGRMVTLRGRLQTDADEVAGWITRGDDDVAPCRASGKLPDIELKCQLGADDEQAWIDVNLRAKGNLMWERASSLVVSAEGRAALKMTPLPKVEGDGGPVALLIAEANRLRAKKKAPALEEAAAQSAIQAKLAPTLVASQLNGDTKLTEQILLGGMAGWDVPGPLSDARGFVEFSPQRTDGSAWVAQILERPAGRIALLDPTMTKVAVGLSQNDPVPGLGGFITTYAPFKKRDSRAIADYAQKKLDEARDKRGLAATRRRPLQALAMALSRIEGGADPTEAFREAADSAQYEMGRSVTAGYLVVSHPSQIVFPEPLIAKPTVAIDIRVVQHDFPETNWGTYIVFFFFADDPRSPRSAAIPSTPHHL